MCASSRHEHSFVSLPKRCLLTLLSSLPLTLRSQPFLHPIHLSIDYRSQERNTKESCKHTIGYDVTFVFLICKLETQATINNAQDNGTSANPGVDIGDSSTFRLLLE